MAASPLQPHAVTAAELAERNATARRGEPFLVYLDGEGCQVLVELAGEQVIIGRQPGSDVCLEWDGAVSRMHARLERVGGHWTVVDDGLSRHGTYLHGERIDGRRRLLDGSGAGPAGNPRIAEALVVGVDGVKHRLGELYDRFGLDQLPQNEKRAALAAAAVRAGIVRAATSEGARHCAPRGVNRRRRSGTVAA